MSKEKVVLAYSGGLDTTALIPWLKENYDYEVICCCVDCGQESELDGLEERAKLSGASKLYIEDITDEFCDDYIVPCVQANAIYENKYLLGTSMARPATNGLLIPARKRLNIANSMALIYHFLQIPATAVTVTYGTSATRVWSLNYQKMNQITTIFLYSVLLQKRHQMRVSMLP